MKSLFDRARAYVSKMEPAIDKSGGDRQTFIVCCKLVEFGLPQSEALQILSEYNLRCQPPWNEKALHRKMRAAFSKTAPSSKFSPAAKRQAWSDWKHEKQSPRWPQISEWARDRVTQNGFSLCDLLDASPMVIDSAKSHAAHYLKTLFPGDPLVCCGKNMMDFWTKKVSEFGRTVENFQFVVPSPMSKLTGKIQDPDPEGPFESAHTLDNTGPRKYAVVEFDQGSHDDHAALLRHLADFAPLIMAVHSGGKSLHGWFRVKGDSEEDVFKFYRYAVSLGADYHTFLKSQFVRIPDGRRNDGRRQAVYYFNPEAIAK